MQKTVKEYTEDQENIISYLKEQVAAGQTYFKSKHIADDLHISSKSVGTNLIKISKKHKTLQIVRWSRALAVTWKVEYNRYARG
jgi:FixJ family two-component response regulator